MTTLTAIHDEVLYSKPSGRTHRGADPPFLYSRQPDTSLRCETEPDTSATSHFGTTKLDTSDPGPMCPDILAPSLSRITGGAVSSELFKVRSAPTFPRSGAELS